MAQRDGAAVSTPHERVDEAILGVYLSGHEHAAHQGGAGAAAAWRAAVEGRGVAPGRAACATISRRGGAAISAEEEIRYVFMDGWYPKVRIGKRRVRVPVLVTLGRAGRMASGWCSTCGWPAKKVRRAGARWSRASSRVTWRGRCWPSIDGNPGLAAALAGAMARHGDSTLHRAQAAELAGQGAGAPARGARRGLPPDDLRRDGRAPWSRRARDSRRSGGCAVRPWSSAWRRPATSCSPFCAFPSRSGRRLRTTNALERINGEFRRRTKTQASLPGQDAVLLLLFGLLRSGQVKLRALVGYQDMERVKKAA